MAIVDIQDIEKVAAILRDLIVKYITMQLMH